MTQGRALITGASRGLGRSFAAALASRNWDLILVARSEADLSSLAEELKRTHGVLVHVFVSDLSRPGAIAKLCESLAGKELQVDLLINNAGFACRGAFWQLPLELQSSLVQLTVQSLVELTHRLLTPMVERGRGGVVNVSSMTGFQPLPYVSTYAAAKAFVTHFSMALAEELRAFNIPVVTLCPGGMQTSFQVIGSTGKHRFPARPMDPKRVVTETLRALERGGGRVIPGVANRWTLRLQRCVPATLLTRLLGRFSRPTGV